MFTDVGHPAGWQVLVSCSSKVMNVDHRAKLLKRINTKPWWHVPPEDQSAYEKRGRFYEATFAGASFYGRPDDVPHRLTVKNPLVGTDESTHEILLGCKPVPWNTYEEVCQKEAVRNRLRSALVTMRSFVSASERISAFKAREGSLSPWSFVL